MLVVASVAVFAAIFSLATTRIERMALGLGVIGVSLAALATMHGAHGAAIALLGATAANIGVIIGGVVVLEVDARPRRTMRAWKLLLLVPLAGAAWAVAPTFADGATQALDDGASLSLAVIAVGIAAVGLPLLVRRAQGVGDAP